MQRITHEEIGQMERFYRSNLINCLSGFKSVSLVGTADRNGLGNLSLVSSVIHIGANPPLMAFIMRPVSVTRDTYNNIMDTGAFTLNHLSESIYQQAHQASARYPADVSEFEATGLTAWQSDGLAAPYVAESPIKIGLEYRQQLGIELNGTILIIGEIKELFLLESAIREDGFLDLEAAGSITCSGLDAYHRTEKLARLSYAKADRPLYKLDF